MSRSERRASTPTDTGAGPLDPSRAGQPAGSVVTASSVLTASSVSPPVATGSPEKQKERLSPLLHRVEVRGIEPLASTVRLLRSAN